MAKTAHRSTHHSEEERLRDHIAHVQGHRNAELVAAIHAELAARPGWSFTDVVAATTLGKTTLYDWWAGKSDVAFSAMRKLVRDLHPEGELSDVRTWLMAGKEHIAGLEQRLEKIERQRRRPLAVRDTIALLQREGTAEGVVRFVSELPDADREVVLRELAGQLAGLQKRKEGSQ